MKKNRVAFAGFEHSHIFDIYNDISKSDLFEIAGAWEPDKKAREAAIKRGVEFTHENFDALLSESDADTVAVGSRYSSRGELVIKALKSGKNIIADKPLCTSLNELCEIERIANEKNLTVSIWLSLRKEPNVLGALTAVKNGAVGEINNIIFEGEHPLSYGKRPAWYFEKGCHGGVINDIGMHGTDLVRILTGSSIKKVNAAREWNFFAKEKTDFKDSAQFMLTLESGAGVIADVSYSAPEAHGYTHSGYWHFRVFGSLGMLDFGINKDEITLYPANGEAVKIAPVQPEKTILEDFYSAVTGEIDKKEYTQGMIESTRQTLITEFYAEGLK